MAFTPTQLQTIRSVVPAIAAARVADAKLSDPSGELTMGLARFLAANAGDWIDSAGATDPTRVSQVAQRFLNSRPKLSRKERHRLEELGAARSSYPSALLTALTLIRVERNASPLPKSVHLFTVFQQPGIYSVAWRGPGGSTERLETLLPLSIGDFRDWERWSAQSLGR